MRCDINGEGEARRGLSSLLVSMTAMYERVEEEQTKTAMLWGWRTPLSPAPLAFLRVRGREDVVSRIEGPSAFVLYLKRLFCCSALRFSLWLDSHGSALDSPNTSYVGTGVVSGHLL